jgi:hypothetical protein
MQSELDLATAEIERAQQRLQALEREKAALAEAAERGGGGVLPGPAQRDAQSRIADEAVRMELGTQVRHNPSYPLHFLCLTLGNIGFMGLSEPELHGVFTWVEEQPIGECSWSVC